MAAALGWVGAWLLAAIACARAEAPPPASERLLPLEVVVNGAKSGSWLLVERNGALYAPRDAFEEWRLERPSDAERIEVKGEAYWSLAAIAGFKSRVDFASQSVELFFSPQAFSASRLTRGVVKKPQLGAVLPSVFFNYDLSYSGSASRDAARVDDVGLLSELGVSTGWGVLTTSGVARNLLADAALGDARRYLRLETTFTRDFPARNVTLRVGDTTTRPAMWERDVYFGGVRFGTNFALTPGYVAQPIPVMTGLSAAPSTVELYVNDVLRQVSNVPAGPFAIDNPGALSGGGEARVVVRDLLGRETVIVQSFFTASQLLAAGLDDWSVEAGRVRRDLGQASDHYGPAFAAGTWRRGLTNALTVEGRVEALADRQSAGGSMVAALPWQWLGKAALAMSHGDAIGAGTSWLVGAERQGLRTAMSLQAQGESRAFRQVGEDDSYMPTRVQVAGNATYVSDRLGTFGFGFATIRRYDNPRVTTISASHSIRVAGQGSLTFSLSRAIDGVSGTAVGLTFVLPLERNRVASVVANSRSGQHDLYATASQNPGPGNDLGWRALGGTIADRGHAEAGVYYLGSKG
ncbi:MAG: fimbria/pilus outer membrane usher protein, partial [Bacillota bacterium]